MHGQYFDEYEYDRRGMVLSDLEAIYQAEYESVCSGALFFLTTQKRKRIGTSNTKRGAESGIAPITMSFLNMGSRMKIFLGSTIFKTRRQR